MHAMPHMAQSPGAGHGHHPSHHQTSNSKPVKVKRTRQRVDAGEPRNSYASIANFSSRGGYHGYSGVGHSKYSSPSGHSANGGNGTNQNANSSSGIHSLSSGGNTAPHQSNSAADQMFASKQLRDQTSALVAAAAAANNRPEMLFDPAVLQMYQSQMAAFLNGAYQSSQAKLQDQLALNSAFCNANAFLSQLQSDASMASLVNNLNMESAAAALLNASNSADAQLLREILEGRVNDQRNGETEQALSEKLNSETSPKSRSRSRSRSTKARFAEFSMDSGADFSDSIATASKEQADRFLLAPPGEERYNSEANCSSSDKVEQQQPQQQLEERRVQGDNGLKAKEGDHDGGYCGEILGCGEEEKGLCRGEGSEGEAKVAERATVSSGRGSGTQSGEEVAKTAGARLAQEPKEERPNRARPSPLSLAERRAKSACSALGSASSTSSSGSSADASGGTSLPEETSCGSFSGKNDSGADRDHLTHHQQQQQQLAHHSALFDSLAAEFDSALQQDPDPDPLCTDDPALDPNARSNSVTPQSQVKRARVENIVSNMLLVTSNPTTTGVAAPSSPSSPALSPIKNYEDEMDSNSMKPQSQGVNGCKKRKLYQPQQSSKLQNANGSVDTEDDDMEEDDQDGAPGIDIGVEAELDESFEEHEDRRRRLSPGHHEMDLSAGLQPRTHRSEHLPTKRARLSDYEREYKLQLQSQLYNIQHKYAMQLYAQQQQQQAQSKGLNGTSHYPRASSVNLASNTECDNNAAEEESTVEKERPIHKNRQSAQSLKIADVDVLIESLKGQILSSIGQIIDTTFRCHLETNNRFSGESGKETSKGNELLAQMLDAKYSRSQSAKSVSANAISLNNGTKNSGRDGSPFALPNEASPAPKSFAYPQTSMASNFYNKQSFYMGNVTPQNFAAAYTNVSNGNGMLLNGMRETASVNSSFSRDNPSPVLPEQTEAISLVVAPKKRRNKVTDSRMTPRTGNRIAREEGREAHSVSPPLITGPMHFNSNALAGVPVSLAGLQHASEFFDPSAGTFPFADQARLNSLFVNGDDADLKNSLSNGVNGASATTNPVVSAVAQAAAAHHLQMLAASRASPDSLNGYPGSLLTSFGRGSGTGSENGGDGSETNDTQSVYDPSMPMISFSQSKPTLSRICQAPSLFPFPCDNSQSNASANHLSSDVHPCLGESPSHCSLDYRSLTPLHTSTLSPMHLRKAKLMFFYVRYPSSSILKMFFPDIKFNKNNTAQLVKWFSNFR